MFTPCLAFLLLGNALAAPAPAPVNTDPDKRIKYLMSRLDAKISEIEKGDVNLPFLLSTLGDLASEPGYEKNPDLRCKILLNVEALRKANEGNFDPEQKQIKFTTKLVNEPLSSVLKMICEQIDGVYLVRRNYIEIIPLAALREELLLSVNSNIVMHPLVCWIGSDVPLESILQDFARRYDANIVIAPTAKEKAKAALSARLLNTPLEVAVGSLAEMVDLKVVRRANVFIVTTKEQAAAMKGVEEKR